MVLPTLLNESRAAILKSEQLIKQIPTHDQSKIHLSLVHASQIELTKAICCELAAIRRAILMHAGIGRESEDV